MFSRSSRGRPKNVLGTYRINLPGTSFGRHITKSPGRHFETSPGRQIETSPDGQIGSLGDVLGTLEEDILGTSWGPIFASWAFYDKEFLKTKIKSHIDEVRDFDDKNILKVDSNHTCLAA